MSETNSQDEPTMEEILASIRKIISDDGEEAEPAADAGTVEEARTAEESDVQDDDVLELTERVEDEDSAIENRIDSILADSGAAPGGGLVSDTTKSGVTTALSGFAGALSQGRGGSSGPALPGGPTLDALVLAVLEPQLKAWLDEHLEPLVERLVKEELKRMARRAEDI